MSSRTVRTMFRGWAATLPTTFIDTINNQVTPPTTGIWSTAVFNVYDSSRITFCNDPHMEEGEITMVYFSSPGIGDDAVLQAAEADIKLLAAKKDPAGHFVLTDHGSPEDWSNGDADSSYRVEVTYRYVFYS